MKFNATDLVLLSALIPAPPNQQRLREILTKNAAEINWETFAAKCSHCCLVPLVRHNFAQANVLEFLPPKIADTFARESHASAAKQQIFASVTKRLIAALTQAEITALPLKGAALMLGEIYPVAGLRSAVDIDLLIAAEKAEQAFQIALQNGFAIEPIPAPKAPLRVPHEMRHLPLLRDTHTNTLLELHYRAFHDLRTRRDFDLAVMQPRAQPKNNFTLPAPEDIALHVIQHSIVDLTSAHLILRTLTDLHFLLAHDNFTREKLLARAAEINLLSATNLALDALAALQSGAPAQAKNDVQILLATALSEGSVLTAARLFEYADLRSQPAQRLKHLLAIARANSADSQKIAGEPNKNLMGKAWQLWARFQWRKLDFLTLRRVARLRKITQGK